MNETEVAAHIESAVIATVPSANGAFVGFATDGSPTRRTLFVRVYLDAVDPAGLVSVVDDTLKIAWRDMPQRPSSIGFQAFEGHKPAEVKRVSMDNVDLTDLEATFGPGSVGLAGQMLDLSAKELTARYGDWKAPADG